MKQQIILLMFSIVFLNACTKKEKEKGNSSCRIVKGSTYSNNTQLEFYKEYDAKNRIIRMGDATVASFYEYDELNKIYYTYNVNQNNDTSMRILAGYLNDHGYCETDVTKKYKLEYDQDNNLIKEIDLATNFISGIYTWQNGNCIAYKSYDNLNNLREEVTYTYNNSVLNSFRFEHFGYSIAYGARSKNAPSSYSRIQYNQNNSVFARSECYWEYTFDSDGKATYYSKKLQQNSKDINGNDVIFNSSTSMVLAYDKCD